MSDDHDTAAELARSVGPLVPRAGVRARVLTSIEAAPQEVSAPARRPWALGTAAAAVLLGVMLWLGARKEDGPSEVPPVVHAAARPPWEEPPEVAKQRAENEACYERERDRLHREFAGKNVVIAHGRLLSADKPGSPPKVEDSGATGSGKITHAFTFKVGEDGPREEAFFSQWYSPRFSGGALPEVLGADWTLGSKSRLRKAGQPEQQGIGPVFPRLRFDLEGPARGSDRPGARLEGAEVFVGTVGPPLMLTPEDAVTLDLFRWEIPGEVTVWKQFRCRQATVAVSVAGWDEPQWITALWPIEPRARLTALSRERDRFWDWGGTLGEMALAASPTLPGVDQPWILFGRDRVLARGSTPGDLLRVVDADTEPTYHRFLMRWPQEAPLVIDEASLESAWGEATINGRKTRCRASAVVPVVDGKAETPILLVEPADALALQADARAEEAREMRLRRADGTEVPLLGGYAWRDDPAVITVGARRQVLPPVAVRVVYALPPPPPASPMPAPDPHRGGR